MTSRAARAAVVLLAAVAVTLGAARPAAAHALLQSTAPVDGQTVEQAPAEVILQFGEPVTASLGAVRVYDDTGTALATGEAVTVDGDGSRLAVALPGDLRDGTYVATWSVTSADAHPVEGAFVFNVRDETADEGVVTAIFSQSRSGDAALGLTAGGVRAIVYAGTLLAAGGVVFLLRVAGRSNAARRSLERVVLTAALSGGIATLLGVAVQGALLSGQGAAALVDPRVLGAIATTSFGLSAFARLAGLVLLGVGVARRWDPAAAVGAVVALVSFTLTGHAVTTEPRWLVVAADLAHTAAGATWFAGLVLLLVAMRARRDDDPAERARLVLRFSALAGTALLLVAAAGLALAWAQVRAPRALLTGYGWTLIAKVSVVAAVVAVAAYNRRRLVPALGRGADRVGALRRAVRLEVIGLVVVLSVTGVLTTLRPARSEAGIGEPFSQYVALGEEYQLNVTVDPNVAGTNQVHIYLLGADGRPADVTDEVALRFSMPANDIAPIERIPSPAGPAHWSIAGPELSIPGPWLVEVTARVSEFDLLTAEVPLTVNA